MQKLYPQQLIQQDNKQYDPYLIPPQMNIIQTHIKAKQIGLIHSNQYQQSLCPCCNMPVDKDPIPLCCSAQTLGFLGMGYTLFFQAIQYYILLLTFIAALVGIYNIQTTSDLCYQQYHFSMLENKEDCYHFIGIAYSTKKSDSQLTIQAVLCLLGTLLMGGGLFLIKYLHFRYPEPKQKSPSQFTIQLRNVPTALGTEAIKTYISQHFGDVQIYRVIRSLDIEQYLHDKQEKIDMLCEQRRIFARLSSPQAIRKKESNLEQQMQLIQQYDRKLKQFEQQISLDDLAFRTGYVFVTFTEDADCAKVLSKCKLGWWDAIRDDFDCLDDCCVKVDNSWQYLNNHKIGIQRAPEPLDIQWGNLNITHSSKRMRRTFSVFASLLLILCGAIIMYLISYSQNEAQKSESNRFYLNYVLSGLCALAIFIVNYLLEWLVKRTSRFEKHSTHTHETRSIVIIQTLMQFINTALIPFGLFIFTDFNSNNLAASLFFIFIGNLIMLPLFELLDPLYIYQLYLRNHILKQGFQTEYTQQQANEIYQGPDYRIADKYSTIHKSILMAAFYLCIFPYGSVLLIIALFIYYWACKYTLLRRCAWPANLSADLHESVFNIMTLLPLIVAAGGICYEMVLIKKNDNIIIHIFNLIVGGIIMILLNYVHVTIQVKNDKIYNFNETKHSFSTDYDRCNPITQYISNEEWKQQQN